MYKRGDRVKITRVGSKNQGRQATLVKDTGRLYANGERIWELVVDGHAFGATPSEYRESSFELYRSGAVPYQQELVPQQTVRSPIITLKDAVLAEAEDAKTKYGTSHIQQEWKKEGRCPNCGELGEYRISVPVCTNHGPY